MKHFNVRSCLAAHVAVSPTQPAEMEQLRVRAWREAAVVVIPLGELYDGEFKETVARWARGRYGLRTAR